MDDVLCKCGARVTTHRIWHPVLGWLLLCVGCVRAEQLVHGGKIEALPVKQFAKVSRG